MERDLQGNGEETGGPVIDDEYEVSDADEDDQDDGERTRRLRAETDAAEHLRGLVVYLATNLVNDPDTVEVEARQRGGSVFISACPGRGAGQSHRPWWAHRPRHAHRADDRRLAEQRPCLARYRRLTIPSPPPPVRRGPPSRA